jgi:hypothetical protein
MPSCSMRMRAVRSVCPIEDGNNRRPDARADPDANVRWLRARSPPADPAASPGPPESSHRSAGSPRHAGPSPTAAARRVASFTVLPASDGTSTSRARSAIASPDQKR